ncbi:MAG: preprotein translocase subunit SecE, partial [Flavobacteriaceae bacterium]
ALVSKTRCREFESLNPCKLRVMNIVSYIKESFSELKEHVSWTALPELSNLTVVVLVFSLIFAGLIWLADSILSRVVKFYFDLIN